MERNPRKFDRSRDTDLVALAREARRATVYAAYREAAADPAFVAEMAAVTRAFDVAVADGLGDVARG